MFRLIKRKDNGLELWRSNGEYIICNKYRREYKFYKFLIDAEMEFYAWDWIYQEWNVQWDEWGDL